MADGVSVCVCVRGRDRQTDRQTPGRRSVLTTVHQCPLKLTKGEEKTKARASFLANTSLYSWVDSLPVKSHSSHPSFLFLPPPPPKKEKLMKIKSCYTMFHYSSI